MTDFDIGYLLPKHAASIKIVKACISGSMNDLKAGIRLGGNVCFKPSTHPIKNESPCFFSPMFMACLYGNLKLAKYLYKKGAASDISIPCPGNMHYVSAPNYKENHFGLDGATPMWAALSQRHLPVAKWLFSITGINDIFRADNLGRNALHSVICCRPLACDGDNGDPCIRTSKRFLYGSKGGHGLKVLKWLLGKNVTTLQLDLPNEYASGETALIMAARRCDTWAVQFLLEHGASVDALDCNGQTALMYSCKIGDLPSLEILMKHGASVDIKEHRGGCTPFLHLAGGKDGSSLYTKPMSETRIQMAKKLFAVSSDILQATNFAFCNAMHYAAQQGDVKFMKWIYDNGGENLIDVNALAGLSIEEIQQRMGITKEMIEKSGRLTYAPMTPMYGALNLARPKVVRLLHKWGVDIDCPISLFEKHVQDDTNILQSCVVALSKNHKAEEMKVSDRSSHMQEAIAYKASRKKCACCKKLAFPGEKFKLCGGCKDTFYCCKEHQVCDWKERSHKIVCKFIKKVVQQKEGEKEGEKMMDEIQKHANILFNRCSLLSEKRLQQQSNPDITTKERETRLATAHECLTIMGVLDKYKHLYDEELFYRYSTNNVNR